MKKLFIRTVVVLSIAGAPALALAQDTDSNTRQTTNTADNEEHGEWGWVGLLGLAGLLGLKRRDRDVTLGHGDRATAR